MYVPRAVSRRAFFVFRSDGFSRPSMNKINDYSVDGRGASDNPENRFHDIHYDPDPEHTDLEEPPDPDTTVIRERPKSILTTNDSPDVGFETSLNPYRGCEHGCVYCYARPTHELLDLSAGLDFESKIIVKENAPSLLKEELKDPSYEPQVVSISGVTDPYQPLEEEFELTRGCLEVFAECRNPVGIVTKNDLVLRDLDLLKPLADDDAVVVNVSVTTLNPSLCGVMEPRTSRPHRRLKTIEKLSNAGIPVNVMVAPVIPGLTDEEIPDILAAASDAGARSAGYVVLRLPRSVKDLFQDWLDEHLPSKKNKILNRIRDMRDGDLNDRSFHSRMKGEGIYAEQIERLVETGCRNAGLNEDRPSLDSSAFTPPSGPQKKLF